MKKLFLVILTIVGPIAAVSRNQLENLHYINKFEDEKHHQSKTLIRVGRDYTEDKDEGDPAQIRQNQPKDNVKLQLVNHKHRGASLQIISCGGFLQFKLHVQSQCKKFRQ